MHTLSALFSFLALSSFVLPSLAQGTDVTPYLTKVFTVIVTLGSPLGPFPLPGGIQERMFCFGPEEVKLLELTYS